MKKWKIYWPYLLLIPFVAAGIAGWFVLPEMLLVNTDGTSMPKLIGLLIPVALSALGASRVCLSGKNRSAGAIILVLVVVAEVLLFAWNL